MFGAFSKSFFRASPKQLAIQMVIDWVWFLLIQPTDPTLKWLFIILLPGIDLISAIGSFRNYLKDNLGK